MDFNNKNQKSRIGWLGVTFSGCQLNPNKGSQNSCVANTEIAIQAPNSRQQIHAEIAIQAPNSRQQIHAEIAIQAPNSWQQINGDIGNNDFWDEIIRQLLISVPEMWIFTYEKLQPHPKLPRVNCSFKCRANRT